MSLALAAALEDSLSDPAVVEEPVHDQRICWSHTANHVFIRKSISCLGCSHSLWITAHADVSMVVRRSDIPEHVMPVDPAFGDLL